MRRIGADIVRATLAAAVLVIAGQARAADPSPEQIAAARSLGTEGIEAAEAGDCVRAIDRLTRAEALYHAPTTLERLGECQIALGHVIAGTESLNRVVRETFRGTVPRAFVAAQARAARELEAAQARIGRISIHIEKPAASDATVTLDGQIVPSALLDVDQPIDPGPHKVEVTAPGCRAAERDLTINPGTKAEVLLTLVADPIPPPPPRTEPPIALAPPPLEAKPHTTSNKTLAFVALGAGGVGLAVGALFGAMALGSKSTLDSACTSDKVCPSASKSDGDALGTQATVSTVGFVVGAVGLVTGVVLLVTGKPTGTHVTAWLGAGSAGIGGRFE